ncbi:MAG: TonB-dependent receptor [Lutimonas sp.]
MRFSILFIFFSIGCVLAQSGKPEQLEEILLRGNFAGSVNPGYSIQTISDSILSSDYQSLGELLEKQSNLYFKQNGYGMVSSISLRGTTASQTGVFWNGIAINSALNGQTDFNTVQGNSFNAVEIRRGGGSVLLGNGAVGGAVNLRDRIPYGQKEAFQIFLGAGSYETYKTQFSGLVSSERFTVKLGLGGMRSENDYPYLGTDLENENGQFENYNANLSLGYKLDERSQILFYSTLFKNGRNLSRTLTVRGNERLENLDTRLMAEWKYLTDRFASSLKIAFLHEDFTYFFDRNQPENRSEGSSDRLIGKYDITYFIGDEMLIKGGVEIENAKGTGSSIDDAQRTDFTAYGLFQHRPAERFTYDLSLRAGTSSAYSIPVIFSVDGRFDLSGSFDLKAAYSSNYRLPTFNDLYWEPGGNPDLEPESSTSGELGIEFKKKKHNISLTGFLIQSQDLIQWQPNAAGIWSPVNIREANNFGIEFAVTGSKKFSEHLLSWNLRYDYTRAVDEELDAQLIYVPEHRANGLFQYGWRTWSAQYQIQYTGEVFITTSNSQSLDDYALSNLEFVKTFLDRRMILSFKLNNLFDQAYQSVAFRPMPNRNGHFNLTYKF